MTLLPLLFACSDSPPTNDTGEAVDTADTDTDTDSGDSGPEPQGEWIQAAQLIGTGTFTYTPTSEPAPEGCAISREMVGEEVLGIDRLICEGCSTTFAGLAVVPPDEYDCFYDYNPSGNIPERWEYWGWGRSGFSRSSYPGFDNVIGDVGEPTEGETYSIEYTGASGTGSFNYEFVAHIEFTWTNSPEIQRPDPDAERDAPYLCGWPQNNPGDLFEPHAVEVGGLIPSLRMEDQCGEPVAIRDFYGEELLMVSASADCPACVYTALAANTYAEANGLRVIVLFEGTDEGFSEAKTTYGAIGPVLRNRWYAQLMTGTVMAGRTGGAWWLADAEQLLVASGNGTLDFSELDEVR